MASNYIKDEQGDTFIPASQRPDGTWRKPRRVKDGYVPQEEVPLYESKGKQFVKNKPTYPVGMSPEYAASLQAKREKEISKSNPIPGLVIQTETKKKKKKNKNKGVTAVTENLAKTKISEQSTAVKNEQTANDKPTVPSNKSKTTANNSSTVSGTANKQLSSVDPLKRLKNLRKKIREIESLETKIKNKDIKNPDKEMLMKVARKAEVQEEIKQLEANQ
ncbi:partner of Y14 and mago [Copidosoma floridanum]|uniref:partner of Y14 and mago n=1 Tax=Copidosoma floridanum TaxID=29053 RepID=UPI0006C99420|nr:partner of Y14 and mago [Copidosoma floridanum]XP_014211575.1 partner of Y14 and mago [Copidosoma floridanum]